MFTAYLLGILLTILLILMLFSYKTGEVLISKHGKIICTIASIIIIILWPIFTIIFIYLLIKLK